MPKMDEFEPRRARGKRPMPMWVDAFIRDTMHLERDQIGAYNLLLYAMWTRPSCDLPNDAKMLARICRCSSKTQWLRHIAPVILPFFEVTKTNIYSKRLRKEAVFVEKYVTQQRCKKTGENPDKYLINIGWASTADETEEKTAAVTYLQPTTYKEKNTKKKPAVSGENDFLSVFAGQEKSEPDNSPPKQSPKVQRFDDFWAVYPFRDGVKRGKAPALKKYTAAVKRGVDEQIIIDGAKRFRSDKKAINGFAPDAATWLHNLGWEDEVCRMGEAPPADTAERRKVRLRILEQTAAEMVDAGRGMWTVGGRFVSGQDLREIWELGLAPEKLGKKD